MRLKKEFIVRTTDEETILVPAGGSGFAGMVRGNQTLGAILDLLKEETTEEQMVKALKQRFDAPESVLTGDVAKALSELRRIGAIDG